ncbi:hypothetical protein [Fastidiosibacter lacustris]|uniref:hypothetical protein n=1 Tax=Fastidiosibacter lacustris TaxID=2056695 RepID=UPI000E3516BB|nr:hypothetical protein [Fastidiosibacter lacustris]
MWYIIIIIMLAISMYVGYRFTLYVDEKIIRNKYLEISDDPDHPANAGDRLFDEKHNKEGR